MRLAGQGATTPERWSGLLKAGNVLINGMATVAGSIVLVAMLLVVASVILRKFMGIGIAWSVQVTEIILVYMTFLAAAWVLRSEGHVRVDIVYNNLSPRLRVLSDIANSVVCLAVSLLLFIYGIEATIRNAQSGMTIGGDVPIPYWTIQIIIPFGAIPLIFQFLARVRDNVRKLGKPVVPEAVEPSIEEITYV